MKYLVVDTETGGVDPEKYSLLQVAAVVWDTATGQIETVLDEYIKDDYECHVEAFNVHGITREQAETGITTYWLVNAFEKIWADHFDEGGESKIPLAGHNIAFDVAFLRKAYRCADTRYESWFRRRTLDTASVLMFLMASGRIEDATPNFETLLKAAGLGEDSREKHSAVEDARLTAEALDRLTRRWIG